MKGIDTNVLARYILQDEPEQSKLATHFIENECSEDTPGFINSVVLCELVWVLESAYHYTRDNIANVIETILRARQFHIYHAEILWQSLRGYRQEGADFADNYIACLNAHQGCEYTVTFDKRASNLKFFKILGQKHHQH